MENTNKNQQRQIICVACPQGCKLDVQRAGEEILVTNEGCKRGIDYAIGEVKDPRRMVATTVRIKGGRHPLLPVYTAEAFPKGIIMNLLKTLREKEVQAPVKVGQAIIKDALGTGIAVLASRDM